MKLLLLTAALSFSLFAAETAPQSKDEVTDTRAAEWAARLIEAYQAWITAPTDSAAVRKQIDEKLDAIRGLDQSPDAVKKRQALQVDLAKLIHLYGREAANRATLKQSYETIAQGYNAARESWTIARLTEKTRAKVEYADRIIDGKFPLPDE
jgi:hypothetical protein